MSETAYKPEECEVIRLGKRVDASSAPVLASQCTELMENNALRLVILDMKDMDYISSAGLKVILFIAQTLRLRQGEVRFVAPKQQVREVFNISGFMPLFQEFASVDDALGAHNVSSLEPA